MATKEPLMVLMQVVQERHTVGRLLLDSLLLTLNRLRYNQATINQFLNQVVMEMFQSSHRLNQVMVSMTIVRCMPAIGRFLIIVS